MSVSNSEIIKPHCDMETAAKLILDLYGIQPTQMKEFVSYDDKNFYFKPENGKTVDNEYVDKDEMCPDGYVFKITNSGDSKDPDCFEAQNEMIAHVGNMGLPAPIPLKNKFNEYQRLEEMDCPLPDGTVERRKYLMRCLKFIPGKIFVDVKPWTGEHFFQIGKFLATMGNALKSFSHPALAKRESIWFLSAVPDLRKYFYCVEDEKRRSLMEEIVDAFDEILPVLPDLETGVIHGDFNEQNIVMRPRDSDSGEYDVYTAIDFGDCNVNPLVFELAITIMYMMTNCTAMHPNMAGGHVLAGYVTERPLPNQEMELLRTLVAGRYTQSLCLGAYSYSKDPGNEYLLTTAKTGWKILDAFWSMPKEELYKGWIEIMEEYKKK